MTQMSGASQTEDVYQCLSTDLLQPKELLTVQHCSQVRQHVNGWNQLMGLTCIYFIIKTVLISILIFV